MFPFPIHPNPTWVPSLSTPVQSARYIFRTYPGEGGGDITFILYSNNITYSKGITDLQILVSECIKQIPSPKTTFQIMLRQDHSVGLTGFVSKAAQRGTQQPETLDRGALHQPTLQSC